MCIVSCVAGDQGIGSDLEVVLPGGREQHVPKEARTKETQEKCRNGLQAPGIRWFAEVRGAAMTDAVVGHISIF